MKLLIYENSAGFSSYTSKLCEELARFKNVEIDYITTPNNSYLKNLNNNVRILPILKDFNKAKKNSLQWIINRLHVSFTNVIRRNRFCKKNKYDAISIQATIPVVDRFFIKSFCRKNRNVIYTVHDVIPPIKSFYWSKKSLGTIYKNVHKLIVHSAGNKAQLTERFGVSSEKVFVVNHGTDSDCVLLDKALCKHKYGLSEKKTVMLFYGLIREQKGLDDLLKALAGIEGVQLFIAGAMPFGEAFDKYKKIINELKIDAIERIEFIPDEETDAIYNACDVVCLPYKYFYSQSGVFMQAIKYRKPVIVSDVSSFSEYLNQYNIGFLCKPNNPLDLREKVEKMSNLLHDDPLFFSEGLEKAARENSWGCSAKKYMDCFSKQLESCD